MASDQKAGPWDRLKLCPVCQGETWCTISPDKKWVRCKRTPSERTNHGHGDGDAWLHEIEPTVRVDIAPKGSRANGTDFPGMHERLQSCLTEDLLGELSDVLGIDGLVLVELEPGWHEEKLAWSFPMYDAGGAVTGLRLRLREGGKKAVYGSIGGVFRSRTPRDGVLLICEGDSDVAAGIALGFDAIGVPGAGTCTDIAVSYARDREVAVVADNDIKGQAAATKLCEAVARVARSACVIYPPGELKDLREWFRQGATKAEVEKKVRAARPARKLRFLAPFELAQQPPREWLVDKVLGVGDLGEMFGSWGTYKSFLAIALAVAVADGTEWLGHVCRQGRALLLCGEGGAGILNRIRAATSVARVADRNDHIHRNLAVADSMPALTEQTGFDETCMAIAHGPSPALVIIDTLARAAAAGALDENSSGDMGKMVNALDKLRHEFPGSAILVVHHSGNEHAERGRGSSSVPAACDTILRARSLAGNNGQVHQVRLEFDKVKDGVRPEPVTVQLGTSRIDETESSLFVDTWERAEKLPGSAKEAPARERLLEALTEAGSGGLSFRESCSVATKANSTISGCLKGMVRAGLLHEFTDENGRKRWRMKQMG